MAVTLYPYKLSTTELEARIPGGVTLLPGQFLRFDKSADAGEFAYGRVLAVRVVRKKVPAKVSAEDTSGAKSRLAGSVVKVQLLYGQPDLSPQTVTMLSDEQLAQEVQRLQEPIAQPLALSPAFHTDATKLGALTLIEGDDLLLKYEALMALVSALQPYQKLVIIDPLGLFEENAQHHYIQAGQELRLSLQAVGHQAFLDAFGQLFPEGLRNWALQAVAVTWPVTQEFIPFDRLLDWRSVSDSPLKSLILQNHQTVLRAGVFAERPNQVMQWKQVVQQACNVIDLSALPNPWKSLFYQELTRMLLETADSNVVPVLIYPEQYLPSPDDVLKKAEESGLNLVVLASAAGAAQWQKFASNRLIAQSQEQLSIEGALTLGLPVSIALSENPVTKPAAKPSPVASLWQQIPEEPVQDLWTQPASLEPPEPPPLELQMPVQAPVVQPIPAQQKIDQEALDYLFPHQTSMRQEQPASTLDYPDADEGAWTEAAGYSPQPQQETTFPGTEGWTLDEFDFDLNLDQKPWDEVQSNQPETAPTPEPLLAYSSVSNRFPEDVGEQTPEPMAPDPNLWPQPETQHTAEGPIDLTYGGETLMSDAVPVYHKSNEPSGNGPAANFQPGERVRHEKYGLGVITKVVPMQESVILNITFESVGKRLLDPALAPLARES